jgi:hypothetical protein
MGPGRRDRGPAQEAAAVWVAEGAGAEAALPPALAEAASARAAATPWRTRSEFPAAKPIVLSAGGR